MWRVLWQMCNWQWHLLSNRADCVFPVYVQAQRARSLGAIVYCVGVKDFNQTQVTQQHCTISCFCASDLNHNNFSVLSVNLYWLYCIACLAGHNCRHHRACVPSYWRIPGPWRNDRLCKCLYLSVHEGVNHLNDPFACVRNTGVTFKMARVGISWLLSTNKDAIPTVLLSWSQIFLSKEV